MRIHACEFLKALFITGITVRTQRSPPPTLWKWKLKAHRAHISLWVGASTQARDMSICRVLVGQHPKMIRANGSTHVFYSQRTVPKFSLLRTGNTWPISNHTHPSSAQLTKIMLTPNPLSLLHKKMGISSPQPPPPKLITGQLYTALTGCASLGQRSEAVFFG